MKIAFCGLNKRLFTNIQICLITCNKCLQTCASLQANQLGNSMRKLLSPSRKKKSFYYETPVLPSAQSVSKGVFDANIASSKTKIPKRINVLNKLFMRHITDLMATGEHAQEILGYGIEISKVKVAPDYQMLNVYWIAKGTEGDSVIEKLLTKNAGYIRNELSQLRLMGSIPVIRFVKDKKYGYVSEVESRLAFADFGEDYETNNLIDKLKCELQIFSPLSMTEKAKIEQLESENELIEPEEPLPEMPQNVLGLNHADILSRINKALKKSEAPHRYNMDTGDNPSDSWVEYKQNQPINEHPLRVNEGEGSTFQEFLVKQQILRMKSKKSDKNYSPDIEVLKEELRQRLQNNYHDDEISTIEEDYLDEDFENSDEYNNINNAHIK